MVCLKLHYGDKGFVLSLDALVAIIIVFFVISALVATMQKKEELPNIYLSKKGSDIIALIDNNKKVDTLDKTQIMDEVSSLLNFEGIEINITTYKTDLSGKSAIDFNIGGEPENFVSSGKRFFIINNNTAITNFGVIKYRIWQR